MPKANVCVRMKGGVGIAARDYRVGIRKTVNFIQMEIRWCVISFLKNSMFGQSMVCAIMRETFGSILAIVSRLCGYWPIF